MNKIICVVLTCVSAVALAGDIVSVRGKGVGENKAEALEDAYRDAVENAVGLYVDAEQEMKNYELVKDEILTQSNAYIEDYDIIEESTTSGGLVKITISAQVKKQALTKRISGKKDAKTFAAGRSLKAAHAKDATLARRDGDGATILSRELRDLNVFAQLCDVSIDSPEPVILSKSGDIAEVAYLLKMEIDRDRYFKELLPSLERKLAQISTSEPKAFTASAEGLGSDDTFFREYLKRDDVDGKIGRGDCETFKLQCCAFAGDLYEKQDLGLGLSGTLHVAVVSSANKSLTLVKGKTYTLDDASRDALVAWRKEKDLSVKAAFAVTFLDAGGEELASEVVTFGGRTRRGEGGAWHRLSPEAVWDVTGENSNIWLVTPWVGSNSPAYYQWFKFRIAKDDLPNVASIKVEYAE